MSQSFVVVCLKELSKRLLWRGRDPIAGRSSSVSLVASACVGGGDMRRSNQLQKQSFPPALPAAIQLTRCAPSQHMSHRNAFCKLHNCVTGHAKAAHHQATEAPCLATLSCLRWFRTQAGKRTSHAEHMRKPSSDRNLFAAARGGASVSANATLQQACGDSTRIVAVAARRRCM